VTSFERIVRPFIARDVTPPQRVLDSQTAADAENLVLQFGKVAAVKTLSGSFASSMSSYMEANNREKRREVTVKRIENPSDPSQFVDVEVIDKLKTRGVNGQENNYEYRNG